MKERLIGLIKTYILFVCIFILQKPLFILYYSSLYAGTSWTDPFKIIWNGLPLDLSLAGYLTAIPGLFFIASAWTLSKALRRIWNGYYFFIAILLAVIFIVDIGLYEYWGFRLDATPLFYFFSSPKDALASISIWQVLGGIVAMILYASLLYVLFLWIQKGIWKRMKLPYRRLSVSGVMLLLTGLLFIPIRWWFYCFYNEHRQSLFQFQPTLEPCSYQSGIQLDGISIQAKRFRQAISFYGSGTGG